MIVLDRSFLEKWANCPYQGYLSMLHDALRAEAIGKAVFPWEAERIKDAPAELVDSLRKVALCGTKGELCEVGIHIHDIIDQAFKACENDLEKIPDWISDNIPRIRPDIQPDAIRAGRFIADQIADFHVPIIGVEKQIDFVLFPAVGSRPEVRVTMRVDLYGQGLNQSLHIWDWKSGYKQRTNSEAVDSFQGQCGAFIMWQQPAYKDVDIVHWWYLETRFGSRAYAKFDRRNEHPRLPHLTQQVAFGVRIEEAARMFLENRRDCWPLETKCCQCDFVRFCKLRHIDAAEIGDDPKLFIDKLASDIADVTRRKKAATAWVKEHGAIEGTACTYTRKPPTNRFTCEMIGNEPTAAKKTTKRKSTAMPITERASTGDDEIDMFFP